MALGRYYFLRSQLSGLVLGVENGSLLPGSPLVTSSQKSADNAGQHFYDDYETDTIRCRLNNFCLDIQDGIAVLNPYTSNKETQDWLVNGFRLQLRRRPDQVLDVVNCDPTPGANVTVSNYVGGANQNWNVEHTRPAYFFLRSKLNDKVLDVSGSDMKPRAKVHMWSQKPYMDDNQLWFEDQTGVIRSKLNSFALEPLGGRFTLMPYDPKNDNQQWILVGNKLINRKDRTKAVDIAENNRANGAQLISYELHGNPNQCWKIDSV